MGRYVGLTWENSPSTATPLSAANLQALDDAIVEAMQYVPPGVIFAYGGATAPTHFLLCDGSVVSQTTYADLYAVIGTVYDTGGEGGGNFRLPDFRGRFPLGKATSGTGSTLGESGGTIDHTHTFSDGFTTGGPSATGLREIGSSAVVAISTHSHSGSVSGTTGTSNPPYLVVNFIIKT
jgi:microcystin-dependent protein